MTTNINRVQARHTRLSLNILTRRAVSTTRSINPADLHSASTESWFFSGGEMRQSIALQHHCSRAKTKFISSVI